MLNVKDLLLAPRLEREQVADLLRPFGVVDFAKADSSLQSLASAPQDRQVLAEMLEEILMAVSQSADPDQSLTYFERFAGAAINKLQLLSYLNNSPEAMQLLAKSLGGSTYMAEILIRDPQHFYWVTDPDILHRPRKKRDIQRDLVRTLKELGTERAQLDYLRAVKRREMLHIGVRDLLRIASVEETLASLSLLAEVLITAAYWISARALREEYGIPHSSFSQFTILAMGKLGGGELNFSSDVDLMYVYASGQKESGGLTAAEYFHRLGQRITRGLSEFTGEGYVYRVDLRLRPEGVAGNIADPVDGYERYYQSRMSAWERLALLKAWPVAGNRQLAKSFLEMAWKFIHATPFDVQTFEEVRTMKRQTDQQAAARRTQGHNVKLGAGGIREIELVTQALQARHGLLGRNTLQALNALYDQNILSGDDRARLAGAYVFLRDVENKLQMVNDAQTHTLPLGQTELIVIARLLGYADADAFAREYQRHTGEVNTIFEDVANRLF